MIPRTSRRHGGGQLRGPRFHRQVPRRGRPPGPISDNHRALSPGNRQRRQQDWPLRGGIVLEPTRAPL